MIARRNFLIGLGAGIITAPAIVRAASLMPVKAIKPVLRGPIVQVYAGGITWVDAEYEIRLADALDWPRIVETYVAALGPNGRFVILPSAEASAA